MDQIQKTALKETAKTIAGIFVIALLAPAAIVLIPTDILATIFGIAALIFLTKMIYDTKLAQAKFDAEYNKKIDQ